MWAARKKIPDLCKRRMWGSPGDVASHLCHADTTRKEDDEPL